MKRRIILLKAITPIAYSAFMIFLWSMPVPADAHGKTSPHLFQTVAANVQATPTVDSTVTALEKEKLNQEVNGLKTDNFWFWVVWTKLSPSITVLVAIGAGFVSFYRWRQDRRDEQKKREHELEVEQEKREDEHFQSLSSVVAGLGEENLSKRTAAAIMLQMVFLRPGYKEFYRQVFNVAVANLRLRNVNPSSSQPLNSLDQVLISVFRESFPLVRDELKAKGHPFDPQSLEATGIKLDDAYLARVDLADAWLQKASLRHAYLREALLKGVNLAEANLEGADLLKTNLEGADLREADLTRANLEGANFTGAHLEGARLIEAHLAGASFQWAQLIKTNLERAHLIGTHLEGAKLIEAHLEGANLGGARLTSAILEGANLEGANFRGAYLQGINLRGANLQGANPEAANSLQDADMNGVLGLSQEQRDACIRKGAILI